MLCIGHRGAMGYAPENTLNSFRKALELGATCVELDVYNVQGTLLVFHDERLERTSNGKGKLMAHDLAYLRSLILAENQRIPTLDEVLQLTTGKVGVNIELKGPNTADAVVDKLLRQPSADWALVSSFDYPALQRVRERDANIRLGILMPQRAVMSKRSVDGVNLDLNAMIAELNPYSLHLPLRGATSKVIEQAQAKGLRVFVYTVNRPRDIARMTDLGVDGVFTDYPDRVPSQKDVPFHGWP